MNAGFYVSYVALWALVVFQTLVLLGLLRKVYGDRREPQRAPNPGALPLGSKLPDFAAVDLGGNDVDATRLSGHATALLFVSPDCTTCAVTLDELEALMDKTGGHVIVFCRAGRGACVELAARYGLSVPVVPDEDLRLSELMGVSVTPTAVLVDRTGHVETYGNPMSPEEFEALVTAASANGPVTVVSSAGTRQSG